MQFFRSLSEPESGDYRSLPGYAEFSDVDRHTLDETYRAVFESRESMGHKIASGIAYETVKQAITEGLGKLVNGRHRAITPFAGSWADSEARRKLMAPGQHHPVTSAGPAVTLPGKFDRPGKTVGGGKRRLNPGPVKEDEFDEPDESVSESEGHKGERWDKTANKWVKATGEATGDTDAHGNSTDVNQKHPSFNAGVKYAKKLNGAAGVVDPHAFINGAAKLHMKKGTGHLADMLARDRHFKAGARATFKESVTTGGGSGIDASSPSFKMGSQLAGQSGWNSREEAWTFAKGKGMTHKLDFVAGWKNRRGRSVNRPSNSGPVKEGNESQP